MERKEIAAAGMTVAVGRKFEGTMSSSHYWAEPQTAIAGVGNPEMRPRPPDLV